VFKVLVGVVLLLSAAHFFWKPHVDDIRVEPSRPAAMTAGGALGLLAGAGVSALMYFGLLTIPAGKLFQVTSGLITLLAAGMAAQAALFLQNGGFINVLTDTVWNTHWLLPEDNIAGRLLHTLIGYSEAPDGAQLLAYAATVLIIVSLMRVIGQRHRAARLAAETGTA
jgi:high-affinity iron transporter